MTEGVRRRRAAFIAHVPRDGTSRVIEFFINPEALSRQLTVEAGQAPSGTEGAAPAAGGGDAAAAETADAAMGALKESFSVQIRLDYADRGPTLDNLNADLGIAPEIAAIEELVHPVESEADANSDGQEAVRPKLPRPTVLFVWGDDRILPVRIASLQINESVFNTFLNPVRAEIDVSLEVLGEAELRTSALAQSALDFTYKRRRALARQYHENATVQQENASKSEGRYEPVPAEGGLQ